MTSVYDNSGNTSGFKDSNTSGDDYGYDANGNMIVDKNKNITEIIYNHLNLPIKITFGTTGTIEYLYDANGKKLEKLVTQGTVATTTKYLEGFQYTNDVLNYFPTAEGYVSKTGSSYKYVFNYTDHLGNIRLSYAKNPTTGLLEILEENNYYPFGLKHKGYNEYNPITNYKYKYNGKELQDELGLNMYDYGARNYDPALGRWMNIDPLAEQMRRWSPYNYCFNNPLRFIDPDGMGPDDVNILISAKPVGTTTIKVIGWQNVNNAPKTIEVPTYAMTITDDVSGTTSTYEVTRDAPVMDTNNPSADNINNAAFEPKQEEATYEGVVDNDYPRGTDLPVIALRNENGGTGLEAEPMPGTERKNPSEANGVSIHVGDVYANPNSKTGFSITGSKGCFTVVGGGDKMKQVGEDIKTR